ncbi:MAG: lytic transglycosylase domain-containing protein [Corynebacteriales bacterium]|nr:lytic transglycosylase domain-containing protein [Mycobacteriales bacterium]
METSSTDTGVSPRPRKARLARLVPTRLATRVAALSVLLLGLGAGLVPILWDESDKADANQIKETELAAMTATSDVIRPPAGAELQRLQEEGTVVAGAQDQAQQLADTASGEIENRADEAERKAEERASRSETRSTPAQGEAAPAVPVDCASYSGNKQIGCSLLSWAGFGTDQMSCLEKLWDKESGWRVNAANPSGAYGIPQSLPGSKMAAYGDDWETNPVPQIKWGLMYIKDRYSTPCGAWSTFQSQGWY